MKLLVTGGRFYRDRARVYAELDAIHAVTPIDLVVHGTVQQGPRGADRWASQWAEERGVVAAEFNAPFYALGRSAGPIRNSAMARFIRWEPGDVCLSFPGENGTADCTKRARAAGLEVREIK